MPTPPVPLCGTDLHLIGGYVSGSYKLILRQQARCLKSGKEVKYAQEGKQLQPSSASERDRWSVHHSGRGAQASKDDCE